MDSVTVIREKTGTIVCSLFSTQVSHVSHLMQSVPCESCLLTFRLMLADLDQSKQLMDKFCDSELLESLDMLLTTSRLRKPHEVRYNAIHDAICEKILEG